MDAPRSYTVNIRAYNGTQAQVEADPENYYSGTSTEITRYLNDGQSMTIDFSSFSTDSNQAAPLAIDLVGFSVEPASIGWMPFIFWGFVTLAAAVIVGLRL